MPNWAEGTEEIPLRSRAWISAQTRLMLSGILLGPIMIGPAASATLEAKGPESAENESVVTVRGDGTSLEDARLDAIRQATQRLTQQLIIADRQIENDAIVVDRVLATMNGYVEKFELLGSGTSSNGFWVEARITLSESRIANFIADARGDGARFDGQTAFAELHRSKAQRQSVAEIVRRGFAGYPHSALSVQLEQIRLTDDDEVLLDVVVSADPTWVASLNGLLTGVAVESLTLGRGGGDGKPPGYGRSSSMPDWSCLQGGANGRGATLYSIYGCSAAGPLLKAAADIGGTVFCLLDEADANCYALPLEALTPFSQVIAQLAQMGMAIDFLDANGRTTKVDNGQCLIAFGLAATSSDGFPSSNEINRHQHFGQVFAPARLYPTQLLPDRFKPTPDDVRPSFINVRPISATYIVKASDFALSNTVAAVFVPVITGGAHRNPDDFVHDISAPLEPVDCTDLMGRAVAAFLRGHPTAPPPRQ